ncbi:MAG: hypothetical protein EON59_00790 [Alphaproteobacteria bacterium]|nr:MAG: hypothetical protein EON59_00790 [Alphaproteobacteria bacterium]
MNTEIGRQVGTSFLAGLTAASLSASILLWYFTARGRSSIARWAIAIMFAFHAFSMTKVLLAANLPQGFPGYLSMAAFVLRGASIWYLFRTDSLVWFRGEKAVISDAELVNERDEAPR